MKISHKLCLGFEALYGIAQAASECSSLDDLCKRGSALIPPAWQYPDITRGRVVFNGQEYVSEPFEPTCWKQTADIVVDGKPCGLIEAYYLEERPEQDEGPFLLAERHLIEGIAKILGAAVSRKRMEMELIRTRDELKLILAQAPFGVVMIGTDRKIRWANEYVRLLAGVTDTDALCGKLCGEYLCPAQQDACPILNQGQTVDNSERILKRHDGKIIPILKTVTQIEFFGEPVLLETFIDVTERKRNEQERESVMAEMERMNRLMNGREKRVIEMKREVNALRAELGREPKYGSVLESQELESSSGVTE